MKILKILLLVLLTLQITGVASAEIFKNTDDFNGKTLIESTITKNKLTKPFNKISFFKQVKDEKDITNYGIEIQNNVFTYLMGTGDSFIYDNGFLKFDNDVNDIIKMKIIKKWDASEIDNSSEYHVLFNIPNNSVIRNRILEAKIITLRVKIASGEYITFVVQPEVLEEWKKIIQIFK